MEDLVSLLECDDRAVVTVKVWLVELLEVRTVTVGQKSDRRGKDKGIDNAVVTVAWLSKKIWMTQTVESVYEKGGMLCALRLQTC